MRQQLRERDVLFVGLAKFGPELRNAAVNVDLMFLQDMKKTRAPDSFCRRPNAEIRSSSQEVSRVLLSIRMSSVGRYLLRSFTSEVPNIFSICGPN